MNKNSLFKFGYDRRDLPNFTYTSGADLAINNIFDIMCKIINRCEFDYTYEDDKIIGVKYKEKHKVDWQEWFMNEEDKEKYGIGYPYNVRYFFNNIDKDLRNEILNMLGVKEMEH